MKKLVLGCLLALGTLSLFNACKDDKDDPNITPTSISIDKTALSLGIGEEYTLTATVNPTNATDKTVTWTSSDATKATVANGKVTAVAAGTVTITAKVGDKTAVCTITIYPIETYTNNVNTLTLDKTNLNLAIGEVYTLTATVSPANATVTWTSSDITKATVYHGKITAMATGSVIITAKAGTATVCCCVIIRSGSNIGTGTGVIINGVKWATCNVAAPGTFASSPEDAGMFYQWNSKKAWPATGSVTGWNSSWTGGYISPSSTDMWTSANDPSPAGYRVPTLAEIQTLLDTTKVTHRWTSQNSVSGETFTDKTTGNSIFLPASGSRFGSDGTLGLVGSDGLYSSSTAYNSHDAYRLFFFSSGSGCLYNDRALGYTVRPVAE